MYINSHAQSFVVVFLTRPSVQIKFPMLELKYEVNSFIMLWIWDYSCYGHRSL